MIGVLHFDPWLQRRKRADASPQRVDTQTQQTCMAPTQNRWRPAPATHLPPRANTRHQVLNGCCTCCLVCWVLAPSSSSCTTSDLYPEAVAIGTWLPVCSRCSAGYTQPPNITNPGVSPVPRAISRMTTLLFPTELSTFCGNPRSIRRGGR